MTSVELTDKEAELFKRFLEYYNQWEKLFESKIDSVRINKNPQTQKLEVWEWYEKESVSYPHIDI